MLIIHRLIRRYTNVTSDALCIILLHLTVHRLVDILYPHSYLGHPMLIERRSPFSGKINVMDLDVTDEQFAQWRGGMLIQNAFPHLTPDEREFLMTGITPTEWDMFIVDHEE